MATFGPQPQVEISIDKVPVTHMTPDRVARLHAQADEARALQLPQLHNAQDLHSKLFVMALDGTQNDAINDPLHSTNIGLISKDINTKYIHTQNVHSEYVSGVGNQKFIAGMLDSAIGLTVQQQANDGYDKLVKQANHWFQDDPDVKISMAGLGFSRGAAALLIASNMVHEKGIPDLKSAVSKQAIDPATGLSHLETSYTHYIVSPGQVPQALILNDQVATGKAEELNRHIAPSVLSVVQLKAEVERRPQFPFYSAEDPARLDPRIHMMTFEGAHSDIGGGYLLNGVSSVTRQINEIVLNKWGAGIDEHAPETDPKKYVIHDSEYLWGDRNAGSPTPPIESGGPRKVIYDKGPEGALGNPLPDSQLLQKFERRSEVEPQKPSIMDILNAMPDAQRAIVLGRVQENIANQRQSQAVDEGMALAW